MVIQQEIYLTIQYSGNEELKTVISLYKKLEDMTHTSGYKKTFSDEESEMIRNINKELKNNNCIDDKINIK